MVLHYPERFLRVTGPWQAGAIAVLAWLLAGCSSGPRPPELRQGEAVYHDEREGFHFRPPAGWTQQARAERLADEAANECLLVKYKRSSQDKLAFFQVSVIDLPPMKELTSFLAERSPGKQWRRSSKPEVVEVNGISGFRQTFTGQWDRTKMVKHEVAVRWGARVFFFAGTFPASDAEAEQLVRQAVAGVVWDGRPGG
jgi:hypothetical protein